jgi:4-hydroxybenzoate polyprenyltransferase
VLSLVVLDSSVAAGFGGLTYGLAVLALLLVASPLSRLFPVT